MLLEQHNYSCEYEMGVMMRIFFDKDEDVRVVTDLDFKNNRINARCSVEFNNQTYFGSYSYNDCSDEKLKKKLCSCACTRAFCEAAGKIRNVSLPWGVMSGIRPAKAITKLVDEGYNIEDAKKWNLRIIN